MILSINSNAKYRKGVVCSILYQFYFSQSIINLMKKDAYLQFNQYSSDPLKQKEMLLVNLPQAQSQMYQNTSKKSIAQSNNFYPIPLQQRPLPVTIKSQDCSITQTNKPNQSIQNPEKIKSSSFNQKNPKPKFEYLAYVQKQLKDEKDKKLNFSSILESEHRLKDDLQQIKSKLETYYIQLQKKDELIVKKEKELFTSNKRYEVAIERIDLLENQCKQLDRHNHDLYQQCMRYQQNEEYNSKLFDNYRILSEKCMQIEQILQQKDAYIQSIILSKSKEYDCAINTKSHEIHALQERISILQSENAQLLSGLKNQSAALRPLQSSTDINSSKFQAIKNQFESKIDFYINQNNRLKNIIGHYEGQLEQLKVQLASMKSTIQAFEDRDNIQKISRIQEQLHYLRDALDMEKMEKDQLVSRHELEILKLENLLSEKREANEGSLLNFCDREKLRENLYLSLEEVARLNQRLLQKQERRG